MKGTFLSRRSVIGAIAAVFAMAAGLQAQVIYDAS